MKVMRSITTGAIAALGLTLAGGAFAAEVTIRVQSVIPTTADEVHMLNEFAQDVADLTNGEVRIKVLPAGCLPDQ